ncbi:MAG: CBS domain-containing protein [Polyangiaceae bacterium]
MSGMPSIGTVMTPLPHSIDIGEDVVTARVLMDEHGIHHLPVTSNGKIAGVITVRDIQVAGALAPERDAALLVREVCHMPAYVAEAADPLDVVLLEMADRQLSSAVVVDHHGKLAGILTLTDVCRLYAASLEGRFPHKSRPLNRAI